jgi:hypothetical protein
MVSLPRCTTITGPETRLRRVATYSPAVRASMAFRCCSSEMLPRARRASRVSTSSGVARIDRDMAGPSQAPVESYGAPSSACGGAEGRPRKTGEPGRSLAARAAAAARGYGMALPSAVSHARARSRGVVDEGITSNPIARRKARMGPPCSDYIINDQRAGPLGWPYRLAGR